MTDVVTKDFKIEKLMSKTLFKVEISFSKYFLYSLQWKLFKNDKKWFLIHLKVLFILKIFKFLGHTEKNSLIRKIRLV